MSRLNPCPSCGNLKPCCLEDSGAGVMSYLVICRKCGTHSKFLRFTVRGAVEDWNDGETVKGIEGMIGEEKVRKWLNSQAKLPKEADDV